MTTARFLNDRHFEECIIQALIVDHNFAEQMIEVVNLQFFNFDHLKETARLYFNYYKEYKAFPSLRLLMTMVKTDIQSVTLQEQIIQYFIKIRKNPLNGDLEYIKDQALDFCRKRSLAIALEKTLDLIEDSRYDQIVPVVQKALISGTEKEIGHKFIDDFEDRMVEESRCPIPMPWGEINNVSQGGPSGGDLCVVCAGTSVGKSHCLVDIGHHALMLGYNVVHYTLELGERGVAHRYDSRTTGIAPEKLIEKKEEVRLKLKEMTGKLVIKSYPTKSASVMTIKGHLHKLAMMDIRPDLIIIDYGDLMRSQHHYEQKRLEEESIYEDLRGLSQELNVPIWTATQTNRTGSDAEVVTLKHIAECFGKAMISDFFLTMSRSKEGSSSNVGNFFIAKSRLGLDGIKYPILIDTSLSKIEILTGEALDKIESNLSVEDRLKKSFSTFQRNGGMRE